ncbi:hypothetical protein XA68_18028 [Ophiocordyceps unilateralis]|uniref:Uncharacterized protein n=1 Tax=Ophiocordyceps unilateralis TaxID=268505 RepID=A0A2A9P3K7_OPHUN|nr:hypothetical protein XA68_18028 [Ophiocordyceps unilateralis]
MEPSVLQFGTRADIQRIGQPARRCQANAPVSLSTYQLRIRGMKRKASFTIDKATQWTSFRASSESGSHVVSLPVAYSSDKIKLICLG